MEGDKKSGQSFVIIRWGVLFVRVLQLLSRLRWWSDIVFQDSDLDGEPDEDDNDQECSTCSCSSDEDSETEIE